MVRTKADNCARKVVGAKAPPKGKTVTQSSSSVGNTPGKGKKSGSGGMNQVCLRPTPEWQQTIDAFFTKETKDEQE